MKTVITTSPAEAADFLRRGGIVAFPTETVYGLGANVFDATAVRKIFDAKGRPADNPLIAHVVNVEQINVLTTQIAESAGKFIDAFFPGPLTVVLKKVPQVPLIVTGGLDTIGVRMPRTELARQFLSACGTPVAAPSANISGRPSPTTWQAVVEDLDGRIDCILQSDATDIGLESTVVDCTSNVPMILRSGSVSIEQLQTIEPETKMYSGVGVESPKSPGLRHRHYSPRAKVVLGDFRSEISNLKIDRAKSRTAYIGMNGRDESFEIQKISRSIEEYAHSVFEFFRECDRTGIETIYCETVEENGIGTALMDRLRRAAE